MGIFKRIAKKLFGKKPLTEDELSDIIKQRIIDGGGSVGDNVHILSSSIDMGEPYLLSIGNNVTITGVKILTHDASTFKSLGYTKVGKVSIGSDVFIGYGTIILPNTTIGSKVIVGAGAVVAKDIPDNSVVAGNPGRIICTYDEYIEKNKKLLEQSPVFDGTPSELMADEEAKKRISVHGGGYIR